MTSPSCPTDPFGPLDGEVTVAARQVEDRIARSHLQPLVDLGHLRGEIGDRQRARDPGAEAIVEPGRERSIQDALSHGLFHGISEYLEYTIAVRVDLARDRAAKAGAIGQDLRRLSWRCGQAQQRRCTLQ